MTAPQHQAPLPQRRRVVTDIPGPRSRELQQRRAAAVTAAVGSTVPFYAARAGGAIIEDVDGNAFIDMGSGIAVTTVGASNPQVAAAVAAQAAAFTHTCFMVTPYAGYVEVAERLAALTPGNHAKKSALFNSGAEAVENAVKIARAATGRDAIVVFDNAYHGRTNLTMAMTAKAMPYKHGFGPFSPEVYRAPGSYPLYDDLDGEVAAARAIATITTQVGADAVAALVIEPIQGEGGFIVPAKGFLAALAEWAKRNGVLFVADEIQTGFARTGAWFACEHEGVVPDLITTAKGIAGGLPLAAVTGRAEIMDAVHAGGLGGTYGGNPAACAAALAAIAEMADNDLPGRARELGARIIFRLKPLAAQDNTLVQVRGRGLMIGLEFVHPDGTPGADIAKAIAAEALSQGVVILVTGTRGNVVRLLPPAVIDEQLLDDALDVLEAAIARHA